jgi:hypothetical protein
MQLLSFQLLLTSPAFVTNVHDEDQEISAIFWSS